MRYVLNKFGDDPFDAVDVLFGVNKSQFGVRRLAADEKVGFERFYEGFRVL